MTEYIGRDVMAKLFKTIHLREIMEQLAQTIFMNTLLKYILVGCLFILIAFSSKGQHRVTCGTNFENISNSKLGFSKEESEKHLKQLTVISESNNNLGTKDKRSKAVRTIPVVFHVIHQYGTENISREQILDQLRILNEDFSRTNSDKSKTRSQFASRAADMEVEFRLAKIDPSGNCTFGITRTVSHLTDGGDELVKGLIKWDIKKYLNIWVVQNIVREATTGIVAGYATLPQLSQNPNDGIVIRSDFVGSIGTSSSGRAGRTLTHEAGHWLGLLHPFYNGCGGSNCSSSGDRICDTPPVSSPSFGCPKSNNTCSNDSPNDLDMVENYMDYANGSCQNAFTNGQKNVINFYLNSSSYRGKFITSSNLIATGIFSTSTCAPIADFYVKDKFLTACAGNSIQFEDLTWNGDIDNRVWTFEGGNPSTSTFKDPTVNYSQGGIYKVKLKVSNAAGSNEIEKTSFIHVFDKFSSLKSPFIESFENVTADNWSKQKSGNYGWEKVSSPTYSGTNALRCYIDENSTTNSKFALTSPPFDLSVHKGLNPVLSFRAAYSMGKTGSGELFIIYGSNDCGKTWKALKGFLGASTLKTVDGVNPNWAPSSTKDWSTFYIDLGKFDFDKNGSLVLKFELTSKAGNSVYLDDINVGRFGLSAKSVSSIGNEFTINPIPSSGLININSASMNKPVSIDIIDATGRIINTLAKNEIFPLGVHKNIEIKKSGVYFVRVYSSKGTLVKKIVITN